jgi:hypothetical protein
MSNVQQTLEMIFMEAAKVFGKEDSEKLLTKVFADAKVEEKSKKEEEKSNKRIPRMTPTITNKLKAELVKAGVTFSNDEKLEKTEMKGFKTELTSYVDSLTNDDFGAKALQYHIEDFAQTKKPSSAPAPAPAKEEKPKKSKKVEVTKVDEDSTIISTGPSNAATIETVDLEQLRDLQNKKLLATPSSTNKVGVYWDAENGRWVTGPNQDDDEDMTEKNFQGKTYAIGDNTGRVYEVTDNKDIFVGFAGVGVFKDLKV